MDRGDIVKRFADYVYYFKAYCTSDAYDHEMLKAVLALLKEQDNCENCAIAIEDRQPVVRCKDCKHGEKSPTFRYYPNLTWCNKYERSHDDCWFCADGVPNET